MKSEFKENSVYDLKFINLKFNFRLANFMDPQQRLLHETTYEALFDAGLDPFSVGGQRAGCFVGEFDFKYFFKLIKIIIFFKLITKKLNALFFKIF